MTEQDVDVAREHGGKPFEVEAPEGGSFRVRFVESDDEAYDRFYNIIANPMLWFIQHYLWDLSNAPDIRRHEVVAFEQGYQQVNRDLAEAVVDEIEGQDEPVVMVHDYHLYTLPAMVREARPDVFLHHFVHIPWTQPDAWRVLPKAMRDEIYQRPAGQRHHRLPHPLLPAQLPAVLPRPDGPRGQLRGRRRRLRRARGVGARVSAADRLRGDARRSPRRPRVREFEERVLARRREYAILRVDRADLSKNVLRGFTAFDIFLEQHPEFAERITFTAQLMPSRTDVPEYAEYLEKIEALVAVVNHRHGTPGLDADRPQAARRPRRGRRLLQALRRDDGQRDVRRHEPRGQGRAAGQRAPRRLDPVARTPAPTRSSASSRCRVNPFDVQELADAIYSALVMSPEARERRARGLKEIVTSRDPGDWIDEQIADIRAKAARPSPPPAASASLRTRTPRAPARGRPRRGVRGGAVRAGAVGAARLAAARSPPVAPRRARAAARAARARAAAAARPAPRAARRRAAPRRARASSPRAAPRAARSAAPRALPAARALAPRRFAPRAPRPRRSPRPRPLRRPSPAARASPPRFSPPSPALAPSALADCPPRAPPPPRLVRSASPAPRAGERCRPGGAAAARGQRARR